MTSAGIELRRIAVPAFAPSVLAAVGQGAVLPVVALRARELGASVGVAAFAVALVSVGTLTMSLPAGSLVARVGERRALIAAAVLDALAMAGAWFSATLWPLGAALVGMGVAAALFNLARQAYITDAVPTGMRARALSTLGGVTRIGLFLGPFAGAAAIDRWGIRAAYAVGLAASLAALAVLLATEDLVPHARAPRPASEPHPNAAAQTADPSASHPNASIETPEPSLSMHLRDKETGGRHGGGNATSRKAGRAALDGGGRMPVAHVLRAHRHTLLTLGTGVLVIAAARAARMSIIPLWADHIGLSAAATALVFGVAGSVDMLLFYPAGSVMDRFGRVWIAVPSVVVLGMGMLLLPLTSTAASVGAVAVVMAIGNGIGSGLVMTLGADAAPPDARAQFLGGWRLFADSGGVAAPLAISAITTVAPLAVASLAMGAMCVGGAGWLARWVPRRPPAT